MIAYLKGNIISRGEDFLILETGGVGYKVLVSEESLKNLSQKKEAEFFIFTYLKRETIELYGCPNPEEFSIFEILEKMSGVGPKTALSLASIGSLKKLKKAVETKDKKKFPQLKGVGKKRMQRILLELTGKFKEMEKKALEQDEALDALLSLGFSKKTARKALEKVPGKIKDTKKRVSEALKAIGKK